MAQHRGGQQPQPDAEPENAYEIPTEGVPEFYVDSMHFSTQLYTSIIYLGEMRAPGKKPVLRLKIKVSPQMFKAMALLLGSQMRQYEEQVGKIALPRQLLHDWGLEEEL